METGATQSTLLVPYVREYPVRLGPLMAAWAGTVSPAVGDDRSSRAVLSFSGSVHDRALKLFRNGPFHEGKFHAPGPMQSAVCCRCGYRDLPDAICIGWSRQ